MQFKSRNLRAIAECVIGDNTSFPYRSSSKITLFFEAKQQVQPAAIRQGLAAVLPKYMLPTAFRQMETLPRNPKHTISSPLKAL